MKKGQERKQVKCRSQHTYWFID